MNRRPRIIGVMGGGTVGPKIEKLAFDLGSRIAKEGWILLNGGRNAGVMEASSKGAKKAGGLVVGILPDDTSLHASEYVDIPICTGMGQARNCINVLSSDVVIACPGGAGTLSEIALSIKCKKPLILLGYSRSSLFETHEASERLFYAETVNEAIDFIKEIRLN
jgi:uncharacterized protein (TIGR00725 family)